MCCDMVLERKGPGSMPLSGEAPLCNGFVAGLDGRQLKSVVLEELGLKRGILSLVRLVPKNIAADVLSVKIPARTG